jgi:hypothetical protein
MIDQDSPAVRYCEQVTSLLIIVNPVLTTTACRSVKRRKLPATAAVIFVDRNESLGASSGRTFLLWHPA